MGQARPNVQSDLRRVSRAMGRATVKPTDAQMEWAGRLTERAEELLGQAEALTGSRLEALNTRLQEAGVRLLGVGR